jgi:AraC-like DNA-binding protein
MIDNRLQSHDTPPSPSPRQRELAERVARFTRIDGHHSTPIRSLELIRTSVSTVCMPTVYQPCLAFVVQGRKRAILNDEIFHYDALNYLVVSLTLPAMGQVIEASEERPYMALRLNLDLEDVARLLLELDERGPPPGAPDRGLFVARMDEGLLDAVLRMIKLIDAPEDAAILAPLVQREIYYRVLRGDLGHRLASAARGEDGNHRVVRAVEWLKHRFAEPLRIEDLADAVHMSPSALHHRFKAITAMSPLQFQKHLRLHEARRLMFSDGVDCAVAGHRVSYESASQFSREYRRLFGAPPRAEIARLRETGLTA